MSEEKKAKLSRRDFLKIAGLAGVAVQAGGLIAGGVAAGKSSESYTGWESFNPGTQFFNREPFRIPSPAHTPVSEVRRASHLTDYVFGRVGVFEAALNANPEWKITDPIEVLGFPPPIVAFYKEYPERMEWDYKTFTETIPNQREDKKLYGNYFFLAEVYSSGWGYHAGMLRKLTAPPEESDLTQAGREGPVPLRTPAVPFKSPEMAAELVKELAHRYGATLVAITKPKLDFFYGDTWQGTPEGYDHSKLPAHWTHAIIIGVPMEWDQIVATPQWSDSSDAYNRVSSAALRIEGMLKFLGYAARANTPNTGYDCLVPPHAIEAGLGEVGRPGFCITPEVGGNCRMALIVTNLEMAVDSPIDFGVADFCNKCKICAESCPSGAISMADSPQEQEWGTGSVIRGYEHWYINNGACYNYWRESMGTMGCRHCIGTCPYARKDNWLHDLAREIDPRDPTGITTSGLLWMQKNFFHYPDAIEYRRPAAGGHFASYGPMPYYMDAAKYLDTEITIP